jgi:FkbM family methyltransferase
MHFVEQAISKLRKAVVPDGLAKACQKPYVALLEALTFGRGLPRSVNGEVPVRVDPRVRYTPEHYEPGVFQWIKRKLSPGDIFFDVGAHVGIYAIYGARWVGENGRVYAFEPTPATVELLKRHTKINPEGQRIQVIAAAAGAESGTASMLAQSVDVQNTLCARSERLPNAQVCRVPVVSLDDFAREHSVIPSLVKIDTEGWELHVLRGASALLKAAKADFVVEIHPYAWEQAGYGRSDFESFLAEHRLTPVPLTGQTSPLTEYGDVYLQRDGE